jgi:hypothetical protein
MELRSLAEQVSGFDECASREKIKIFAWWLHNHGGKEVFGSAEIRICFNQLHLAEPPALSTYLTRMTKAKDLLNQKGQYKLARIIRADLDRKFGIHHSAATVNKILKELPEKIPDVSESKFLDEALKCYRAEAYRSCIIMTWNLAYSHLLGWILKDANRAAGFNSAISKRYPKKNLTFIRNYNDFLDELKEREVIEICSTGRLVNSNIIKILREKLDRRNTSAHPSTLVVVQSQADDTITDLVNNVVIALA